MLRLAVPLVLLLLLLFAGAAWLAEDAPSPRAPQQAAKEHAKDRPDDQAKRPEQPQADKQARAEKPDSLDETARDLKDALSPPDKGPQDSGGPSFDIARIDPKGTSVFAGRAEPNSLVTITVDGKEVGTAAVDENGEWTLNTDAKIANPDGKLALFKAPPGSVARVVGAEPQREAPKAAAAAAPEPKQKTASAVASRMLKSLENMVAAARTEANPPAAPSPTLPAPAATTPPAVAEPQITATNPGTQEARASSAPSSTAAPAAPSAQAPAATSPTSRVPESTTVPVPVTFVFNEATLTYEGRKAASLLLEYLQLKRFPKVTLTGHADERGSDDLNMELSRERLETVAQFLRAGGYKGGLDLIPMGKSEPYRGVVRGDFSQEDLWQLDRRVELIVSR